jgi:hypothetical protein
VKTKLAFVLGMIAVLPLPLLSDDFEGVDTKITREECVLHAGSFLLQDTYVSVHAVAGGAGKSWGPVYVINLHPTRPGYRLYESEFIMRGEGTCAVADTMDASLNVTAQASLGTFYPGTAAGENCQVYARHEPPAPDLLGYSWRLQGHEKTGSTQYPATETIVVYWQPTSGSMVCPVPGSLAK